MYKKFLSTSYSYTLALIGISKDMITTPFLKLTTGIILIIFVACNFSSCTNIPDSKPGIYINEILTSNSGVNVDSLKHEHADWIELYNSYDSPVDLGGYYLSDKEKDTTKWRIPEGTIIGSNKHLIIWADAIDTLLHTNYKLSKDGGNVTLYSRAKKVVDRIEYSTQGLNISYGRKWDGVNQWAYFDNPSPWVSNTKQISIDSLIYSNEPIFSLNAGFYDKDQLLSLSNPNAEIRYTLDGSLPNKNSPLYKNSLKIDSTSVVRAISIEKGKLVSKTVTKTYFINVTKDLPVVSLVSDPVALWDPINGIYQNSLRAVERMANVEFFEDQKQVINQSIDIQLSGNWARFHGQKAILLETKGKYEQGTFVYQFFPDKRTYSFQSLLLRAGGHPDKYSTTFRDGFGESLVDEHLEIDHSGYRPVVVYLNGKYWGIYNIREKINANFLVDNQNVDVNKFDMLANSWLEEKNGDRKHYQKTLKYITECGKNNATNYEYVKTLIDVNNYIDYTICQLYTANIDWPNWNIKFWRDKKEDAKWKWILIDLDYCFGSGAKVDFNMIEFASSPVRTLDYKNTNPPVATLLFRKMLEFSEFKNEFIQRFAVSLNVIYPTERVLKIMEEFKAQKVKEMPLHIERWKDSIYPSPWGDYDFKIPSSIDNWEKEIEVIRDFVKKRPDVVRENLMKKFNIEGTVLIKTIANNGHIAINTINLDEGSLEAQYFKGISMNLEAIPNPGQQFLYWIVNGKENSSTKLRFNPISNGTIEAVFGENGQSQIPCFITENTTLTANKSPYYAACDIVVNKGVTLSIEKGVQILMEKHRSILVYGGLICNGTKNEPISIIPNPKTKTKEWGAICIDNASSAIELNHVNLSNGTWYEDKLKYKATITSINSNIALNHVNLESSHFPFYSEYGKVSIRNSRITSPKTCDIINIKYSSKALVESCDLSGNDYPDTDAIDFDQVENGIIRDNTIYGFFGFNSDAIDIGEASSNILIEGNRIFNMSDKGVSVGQGASAIIRNNFFYGCIMGVGIKDKNSFAKIEQNTFYGNKYGVSVFEKNRNAGGGSAEIVNCIFSESKKKSVFVDSFSKTNVSYSLSDKEVLIGEGNIYGDAGFENELRFIFNLKDSSLARKSGNELKNLGAEISIPRQKVPDVVITEISCSAIDENGVNDWVEIYNNSSEDIDMTGWTIKNEKHHSYAFPQKFVLKKKEYIVLTNDRDKFLNDFSIVRNFRENLTEKIITKGNILMLHDSKMNLVDYVDYKNMSIWSNNYRDTGIRMELKANTVGNDKEKNWMIGDLELGTPGVKNGSYFGLSTTEKNERINFYINKIKKTPEWLNNVKKQAIEQNKTLKQMIKENAEYMVLTVG